MIARHPLTAAFAVLFALLTAAAYGSGTGPGTTGNAGADAVTVTPATADAVRRMQEAPPVQVLPPVDAPRAVEAPPVEAPQPATAVKRPAKKQKQKHRGKGRGLGNTYCQELKGTGGPAFGQCIAAKAHERQAGKRKKR